MPFIALLSTPDDLSMQAKYGSRNFWMWWKWSRNGRTVITVILAANNDEILAYVLLCDVASNFWFILRIKTECWWYFNDNLYSICLHWQMHRYWLPSTTTDTISNNKTRFYATCTLNWILQQWTTLTLFIYRYCVGIYMRKRNTRTLKRSVTTCHCWLVKNGYRNKFLVNWK